MSYGYSGYTHRREITFGPVDQWGGIRIGPLYSLCGYIPNTKAPSLVVRYTPKLVLGKFDVCGSLQLKFNT